MTRETAQELRARGVEVSADHARWMEEDAREHEQVLAQQPRVQRFLEALTTLSRESGITLQPCCELSLESGDLKLLEYVSWSDEDGYRGDVPD